MTSSSSLHGDHLQRLEDVHTVWINGFSTTAVVGAMCTLVWFTAADSVSRKKLLIVSVLLKVVYFVLMCLLLSGFSSIWRTRLWLKWWDPLSGDWALGRFGNGSGIVWDLIRDFIRDFIRDLIISCFTRFSAKIVVF